MQVEADLCHVRTYMYCSLFIAGMLVIKDFQTKSISAVFIGMKCWDKNLSNNLVYIYSKK